ncbi:MAG: PIN domain-containing protein [archaeon]
MKLVLDASAIINGFSEEGELMTTLAVSKEIGDRDIGEVVVRNPKEEFVQIVAEKVKEKNDNLSEQDIGLLALALEFKAQVVTDDYGIQNIAKLLGIKFIPIAQEGIKEVLKWQYYCPGCRKHYKQDGVCGVCGTGLKRRAKESI